MPTKEDILGKIAQAKQDRINIPVRDEDGTIISLMIPFGTTEEEVKLVADWREMARDWYPTVFPYNLENTKKWIEKQVEGHPERILFFLTTMDGERWGHLGLATFSWEEPVSCELDAVMRGRDDIHLGVMTHAVRALIEWTKNHLGITRIGLRVFAENDRAIRLYERVGFEKDRLIPLVFEKGDPISSWREAKEGEAPERHFQVMRLK